MRTITYNNATIIDVNHSGVNQDVIISNLVRMGIIAPTSTRGRYNITYVYGQSMVQGRRDDILAHFTIMVAENRHYWNLDHVARALVPEFRTIRRYGYHSSRPGFDIDRALAAIQPDEDGIVRSFGIEYEIYSLTRAQESKLAALLDTLPMHVCENDASLGNNGVEIVFAPVGAEEYIRIVNTLADFVRTNNVQMQYDSQRQAGMHTTYGISRTSATRSDMQIRLNRFAFAVQAVGTQQAITSLFGRTFGHYRELPTSTTTNAHGNAFSTNGRPSTCWECRLTSWRCDAARMVEFFRATESVFSRPFNESDFAAIFAIMNGTSTVDGQ